MKKYFIIFSLIAILTSLYPISVQAYEVGLDIDINNIKEDESKNRVYNTTISKINHSNGLNIVMMQKDDNNCYYFVTEENSWEAGEPITITVDSNDIVRKAVPYLTKREKYKLGNNGQIYVKQLTNDEDLKRYANMWLKDNYNMTLNIPIEFNSINQDKEDCIIYGQTEYNNHIPTKITISSDLNKIENDTNVITERMLIHELTHYALAIKGQEYEDNTSNFTNEAIKNGATIDGKNNDEGILHSHVVVNQNLI